MAAALSETLNDGLHDLTDHEYFALDAVNRSFLWEMRKSPAHAKALDWAPKESAALNLGSAFHLAVLEPDRLETDFAIKPEGTERRSNKGKAAWAEFLAANEDKQILDDSLALDKLKGVRDSIQAHPMARRLCTGPGVTEKTALWTDPETGVRCKAKYDRIVPGGDGTIIVPDLKSTRDASPRGFMRAVANYGYHFQNVFYLDGLNAVAGIQARSFVFVAVENVPPYAVALYELDIGFIEAGRRMVGELLPLYAKCKESGKWPGYPQNIEILEAPSWVT